MIRRDLILLVVCAVIAWPLAAAAERPSGTYYKAAFQQAQHAYGKLSHPSEADRANYITHLIRIRERAARLNSDEWKAIDAEIRLHPAPKDDVKLARQLIGDWQSPRHDYRYVSDGTWTMLPADEGTTHGNWRIDGNQYVDTASIYPDKPFQTTVILISKRYFVTADDEGVFYETRLK